MDPCHEMVKVLTPGGNAQAAVEQVHEPGLAAADRPPQVKPLGGTAPLEGFETGLQGIDGLRLLRVGDVALIGKGLLIERFGVKCHAALC
ncbi:hypothetical protein D3C73_1111400 [compost metagenome]